MQTEMVSEVYVQLAVIYTTLYCTQNARMHNEHGYEFCYPARPAISNHGMRPLMHEASS